MLKKHSINLLVVLLVVFVFVGVLSLNVLAEEDDRYGGTIRVPIEDVSLPRMDPHYADNMGNQNIGLFIAEPLVFFTDGEYLPVLAEDWKFLKMLQHILYLLEKGFYFIMVKH